MLVVLTCQWCCAEPGIVLTDLMDTPHDLQSICRGRKALIFVCDLSLSTCREGAVYFDSRADMIKEEGILPLHVFVGSPPEIRDAVLTLGLKTAAYIDVEERIFGTLLDEKILPALVLLDGHGRVVETLYGGGESLDSNIRALVAGAEGSGRRWWLLLVPLAVLAILPFVLD